MSHLLNILQKAFSIAHRTRKPTHSACQGLKKIRPPPHYKHNAHVFLVPTSAIFINVLELERSLPHHFPPKKQCQDKPLKLIHVFKYLIKTKLTKNLTHVDLR